MEVERLPRHLAHEVHALHRHPRIPEEQDVEAGDEHVVGVVAARASRRSRSGQPSVANGQSAEENQVSRTSGSLAQRDALAGLRLRLRLGLGDEDLAVLGEPGRDPVPPPQLARHAPRLDILQPVEAGLLPASSGTILIAPERTASIAGLRERRGIDIPLVGQPRLDHHARAVADTASGSCAARRRARRRPCRRAGRGRLRLRAARRPPCAPRSGRGRAARPGSGRRRSATTLRLGIEHVEHLAGLEARRACRPRNR